MLSKGGTSHIRRGKAYDVISRQTRFLLISRAANRFLLDITAMTRFLPQATRT